MYEMAGRSSTIGQRMGIVVDKQDFRDYEHEDQHFFFFRKEKIGKQSKISLSRFTNYLTKLTELIN